MDSALFGFVLLTVFAIIGGAAGSCVHVENDDMLEYSCSGGDPSDLRSIPAGAEKIRIANMIIPVITTDMFSRFGQSLWVLACSHCDVVDIEPTAFQSLINLQQLSLDNNRLTTVRGSWFKGLEYLTYLDLNYNQITTIEDNVYENLPSLVDFRLSGNRFECLNSRAMEKLAQLKRIFLSENAEFKCPNAISKFLDDRGVSFDRDPEWKDTDEVSVDDASVHQEETFAVWSTTPAYRQRLHFPPVVETTEDTRSSYDVPPEPSTRMPESTRYPLYATARVATSNYTNGMSQFPPDDSPPVTATERPDVQRYQTPIADPYRPYVTTPTQPSRYPSARPWPAVAEDDTTVDHEYYDERLDYSDEVSGTPSLAPSPTNREGSPPFLDPRNTLSTEPPETHWTEDEILIEPNYPLPNPPWQSRIDVDQEDVQTITTEETRRQPASPYYPPSVQYIPPEIVQPAAPNEFLQVPYYEPTVTVRRPLPPQPPPSVLQNYEDHSSMTNTVETTTTDKPLPMCPNRSTSWKSSHSSELTITLIVLTFLMNIVVQRF